MIEQTVLPFKLENTMDLITAHAGSALLGEFAVGLGLNKDLSGPGGGKGCLTNGQIFPLVLMLNGGGRTLKAIRVIRNYPGLRLILLLERIWIKI